MSLSKANPIGGFFELEDTSNTKEGEYYSNLYSFNTARSIIETLIRIRNIKKMYLPAYFCNVILEPIQKTHCLFEFYEVNDCLEIDGDINLNEDEYLLYINYFGLKQDYVKKVTTKYRRIIIDNSQAFFDQPLLDIDTFYSPRKIFGIPDGSYLSTILEVDVEKFEEANSENRISHLIKRKKVGPEKAYFNFVENEKKLNNLPILRMSSYTKNILSSINYNEVRKKRRNNFEKLHNTLKKINKLPINYLPKTVPLCYPLYIDGGNLIRNELIQNKIFVPKYWPNLEKGYSDFKITEQLAENIVALPIDQRYDLKDMEYILRIIK